MYNPDALSSPLAQADARSLIRKTRSGKIRIGASNTHMRAVKLTLLTLLAITVFSFFSFDYKGLKFFEAVVGTLHNVGIVFFQPVLKNVTLPTVLYNLLVTFCLGILATFFGALIALFASLLCAKNIARPGVANVVKAIAAFVRAVPTILWVLIFAVSAGLGSVAAVSGLTFHSACYLIKAYSESIEELDGGTIEALKACGASYWQIVVQAIWPSSVRRMLAWTFMRFEINFINAIAVGAAAGCGGIGYDMFMAGSYYLNLREMGLLIYVVIAAVVLLEIAATKVKSLAK